ncbi:MAG: SEC-C metal-binding domain-containing protein, partial [Alphaproteobacteria bacterium]
NMAGRGTDIKLGGIDATDKQRQEILDCGGLYVLGTERHESRRIDNQLRGRSGRQGDVGETKFYLSLEDDLMRIFGSDRLDGLLKKLGIEEGEAITHPWVSRALVKAQQKVEGHNFEIRKQLIKYDDVTNEQRIAMFDLRKKYMTTDDIFAEFDEIRYNVLEDTVSNCIPDNAMANKWDTEKLKIDSARLFAVDVDIDAWVKEGGIDAQEVFTRIKNLSDARITELRSFDETAIKDATASIMIQILDSCWKDHLLQMDHLRQGIGLRAYGQKDPLNEYKKDSYEMYEAFLNYSYNLMTQYISHLQIEMAEPEQTELPMEQPRTLSEDEMNAVGRNQPCPCGSGKKYKHCCGKK